MRRQSPCGVRSAPLRGFLLRADVWLATRNLYHKGATFMNTVSKLVIAASVAVAILATLLVGARAQQPDYTAQCSNGIAVPHPHNNPGLVSDCAALLTTKDSLDPDGQRLDWSDNVSIHDWGGIAIESTLDGAYFKDRVVALSLWHMTGSIPPELGNLANLRWLELRYSQLTGSIPSELGNLANLDALYLSDNQLTGSIPSALGNLANLDELDFSDNQLTGSIPPELGNLFNLRELYLNDNQLTGSIPPELGNLANLQRLSLNVNQLTGSIPPELGNLANLDALYLSDNQLTGSIPPELGNLANLRYLYLRGNQLTGCIPAALREVEVHDFGSLGLPLCASSVATPTPSPTSTPPHPTATPTSTSTPRPTATPTTVPTAMSTPASEPTATPQPQPTPTPITPTVPAEVLNRLSALEALMTALQGIMAALESRIAALESDATRPEPTPTLTPVPLTPMPIPTLVPTQPPVQTPAPSPTPDAAEACIQTIQIDNAVSLINGSWNADCEASTPAPEGGVRYARYYIFTLTATSTVTIDLISDEDTYLYLREGAGQRGAVVSENDDIDTAAEILDSRIEADLQPGVYTIEATTYEPQIAVAFQVILTIQ